MNNSIVYTMFQPKVSVKAILYLHKTLKDGSHPIMLQVIHNRRVKRKSLELSSYPDDWDETLECFKSTAKNSRPNNKTLAAVKTKAEATLDWFRVNKIPFTYEKFIQQMGKTPKPKNLVRWFDELITGFENQGKAGNRRVYVETKNALKRFVGKKEILLRDIDFAFLKGFEEFLRINGNSDTTIHLRIRTLRAAYFRALNSGLVVEEDNPFARSPYDKGRYSLSSLKLGTNPRALSSNDMDRIKRFDSRTEPKIKFWHTLFLFSYYAQGMSFSDIARLTWESIHDGRILYRRKKGQQPISIKISEQIEQILKQFEGKSEGYVFPILDPTIHTTEQSKLDRVKKCRAQMNKAMCRIRNILGIKQPITSYTARHTYAMALRRGGKSDEVISTNLGHSNLLVTRHYLSQLDQPVYDEANDVL